MTTPAKQPGRAQREFERGQQEPLRTLDDRPLYLGNLFRGRSAFLVCRGKSAEKASDGLLDPFVTMAVNAYAPTLYPKLWVCADPPHHFDAQHWYDPTVMKFLPFDLASHAAHGQPARDFPGVVLYHRTRKWEPPLFLPGPMVQWGDFPTEADRGVRSVMLPALRILFHLGVRRVFLVGADFHNNPHPYYFEKLSAKLDALRPHFEEHGLQVLNCNEASSLRAFDFISLSQAIGLAAQELRARGLDNKERA